MNERIDNESLTSAEERRIADHENFRGGHNNK